MQFAADVVKFALASANFLAIIDRIIVVVNLTRASIQVHDLRREPEFVTIDRGSVGRHLVAPSSSGRATDWLNRFDVEAKPLQSPDHESSDLNLVTQQRMTFRNTLDHDGLALLVDLLRQAVAAMRASVATNSGTSAHFSDKIEKDIGSRP